jgi:hypothetical protein
MQARTRSCRRDGCAVSAPKQAGETHLSFGARIWVQCEARCTEFASGKNPDSALGFDGRYRADGSDRGDRLVEIQYVECTNEDQIITGWRKAYAADNAPGQLSVGQNLADTSTRSILPALEAQPRLLQE